MLERRRWTLVLAAATVVAGLAGCTTTPPGPSAEERAKAVVANAARVNG